MEQPLQQRRIKNPLKRERRDAEAALSLLHFFRGDICEYRIYNLQEQQQQQ